MNSKPYVFISYAHLDDQAVLPCLHIMKRNGINIWYDEGIEAGSEWPEYIAEKVLSCSKFVLFISNAYLNSQNCKRELNFAISHKKDILSIFLEDVVLSPGMEMQLGTYQAIYKKRFESAAAFHNSLSMESFFNPCRVSEKSAPSLNKEDFGAVFGNFFGNTAAKAPQPQQPQQPQQPPRPQHTPPPQSPGAQQKAQRPVKSRLVAALLAFLLGSFGAQKFYLKQPIQGVIYAIFFWTYLPFIASIIEGIMILTVSDEKFEKWYKCKPKAR